MNVSNFMIKFGIIGLLLLTFQIVNGMEPENRSEFREKWTCSGCTLVNNSNIYLCKLCGRSMKSFTAPNEWICPSCTLLNKSSSKKCEVCEEPKTVQIILEPGPNGIELVTDELHNGQILDVKVTAQECLHDAGITKGYKIIKIDGEIYSHELLKRKKSGKHSYSIEVVYLSPQQNMNWCHSLDERQAESAMSVMREAIENAGEFNEQVVTEMQNTFNFTSAQTQQLYEHLNPQEVTNENEIDQLIQEFGCTYQIAAGLLEHFGLEEAMMVMWLEIQQNETHQNQHNEHNSHKRTDIINDNSVDGSRRIEASNDIEDNINQVNEIEFEEEEEISDIGKIVDTNIKRKRK